MHNGNPETSLRLSRTLTFLRAAGKFGATSAEIRNFTNSVAPGTDVSELRHSGHYILCKYDHRTPKGNKVYRYTYIGKKES